MENLVWNTSSFDQLTSHTLYKILALRCDIFVVEQDCPYLDLDGIDLKPEVYQLWCQDEEQNILATARLIPQGIIDQDIHIGRVCVLESARAQKLGHVLMAKAVDDAQKIWGKQRIVISAQAHLEKFYAKHGFEKASEIYLEDNIEHIKMIREA